MKKTYGYIYWGVAAMLFSQFAAGCSLGNHDPALVEKTPTARSQFADSSPQEIAGAAAQEIKEAEGADLALYSPTLFANALKEMNNLTKQKLEHGDRDKMIATAQRIHDTLAGARAVKDKALQILTISISEKQLLDEYKAEKLFPKEYAAIRKQFQEASQKIEANDPGGALKIEPKLADNIRVLLIRTIEASLLRDSKDFLAKGAELGAGKLAPKTFGEAQLLFQQTSNFINSYPRNKEGITEQVKRSTAASQHAYYVCQDVKALTSTKITDVETFVLGLEEQLVGIAQALNIESKEHYLPLAQKAAALRSESVRIAATMSAREEANKALTKELDDATGKIAELQKLADQLTTVEGENASLKTGITNLNNDLKIKQDGLTELAMVKEQLAKDAEIITTLQREKGALGISLGLLKEMQIAAQARNSDAVAAADASPEPPAAPVNVAPTQTPQ